MPDGTTLAGLVNLINSDANNPGVIASILDDGLDSDTSHHLVLTGEDTGKANYILIDAEATTLDGTDSTIDFRASTFTEMQSAQNCQVKINDYGIERSSNVINDVIEGTTFTLVSDASSATATITWDTATIKSHIQQLVTSHNFIIDYIKEQTSYDEDGDNGVMIGNYGFQIVQQRLNNIMTNSVPGLADGTDTYSHLSQIGVYSDPDDDGEWKIDEATLISALNTDLQAVKKLIILDTDRTVGAPEKDLFRMDGHSVH